MLLVLGHLLLTAVNDAGDLMVLDAHMTLQVLNRKLRFLHLVFKH
jgi:hypothetical protein